MPRVGVKQKSVVGGVRWTRVMCPVVPVFPRLRGCLLISNAPCERTHAASTAHGTRPDLAAGTRLAHKWKPCSAHSHKRQPFRAGALQRLCSAHSDAVTSRPRPALSCGGRYQRSTARTGRTAIDRGTGTAAQRPGAGEPGPKPQRQDGARSAARRWGSAREHLQNAGRLAHQHRVRRGGGRGGTGTVHRVPSGARLVQFAVPPQRRRDAAPTPTPPPRPVAWPRPLLQPGPSAPLPRRTGRKRSRDGTWRPAPKRPVGAEWRTECLSNGGGRTAAAARCHRWGRVPGIRWGGGGGGS